MSTLWQEDNEAWFSRSDRFDGFDRGDLDNLYADDYNSVSTADAACDLVHPNGCTCPDRGFEFCNCPLRTTRSLT